MKIRNYIRDIFSCVLSDRSILNYNKKNLLVEGTLSESQIQPNSIDLTLANTWKKIESNAVIHHSANEVMLGSKNSVSLVEPIIDPKNPIQYTEGLFEKNEETGEEYYKLMPGEFILMASNEILNIPNGILSFVQGRSSIARLGIQTEQAGLIDAGFRGTITFEVCNESQYPIYLYKGMRVAQVYFFRAQYANKIYGNEKGSKYHNQIAATGSKIHLDPDLKKY